MLSRTHSTLIDHIHILGVGLTKQFRKKTTTKCHKIPTFNKRTNVP